MKRTTCLPWVLALHVSLLIVALAVGACLGAPRPWRSCGPAVQAQAPLADASASRVAAETSIHFVARPLPADTGIVSMIAAPNGDIYVGTVNATIFKSTNEGLTWTALPVLPQPFVQCLCVNARGELVAAYGSVTKQYPGGVPSVAVFRGGGWSVSNGITASRMISSIALAPNGRDLLAVTAWNGDLWRSMDDGISFSRVTSNLFTTVGKGPGALWLVKSIGSKVYAGGEGDLLVSDDDGLTFKDIDPPGLHGNLFYLVANLNGDLLQDRNVNATGAPLIRYTHGTWIDTVGMEPWTVIGGLAAHRKYGDFLYCSTLNRSRQAGGLYISTDGGSTWHKVTTNLASLIPPKPYVQSRNLLITRSGNLMLTDSGLHSRVFISDSPVP